jgi:glycosyltransferase involved in cell wall biosynthesis
MRFAVVLDSVTLSGVPRMQWQLAAELASRGHAVDLVLSRRHGALADPPPDVRLVELGAPRTVRALGPMARYLRRRRPEVVLSAEDHLNVVVIAAAGLARCNAKICVTNRVPLFRRAYRPWEKSYWIIKAMAALYPRADCVGAVSSGLGDDLAAALGIHRAGVATLHNPIVTADVLDAIHAPCPHDWFLENDPVLCACGTLSRPKAQDVLLRAFALLRRDMKARLIVVGEGRQRAYLEALARRLGIDSDVDFVGAKPNPYPYMARASLFVLSSVFEGLPSVLVEALACGTPVVATDCRHGPREVLEGGRHGRLVPVGDVERLTVAMRETLVDPPDAERLRGRGMDFTAAKSVDGYLTALGVDDAA